ncbi:MAG: glycoside hydrolase family 3 N-terminal domain-containing protein [Solirubrobacterales bacterium]
MKSALVAVIALAAAIGAAPQPDVQSMTTAELIGQRIVTGYVGTTPPRAVLRAVKLGHIGGVILFANNMPKPATARRAIKKLQATAKAAGRPPLFLMIDQEGGIVQRLPTLPPTLTPAQMGRANDPAATALKQGKATGRALKKYGFNVNLAPVVDVPRVKNSFLGNRAYSRHADVVAGAGCGFAQGNEAGGVAATFKHFPGLGRAGADTDFDDVKINATEAQIESGLAAYKQCQPSFVMIASARYPKLGINVPSSLSPKTYELLKGTGFTGLTITDAMETPQFSATGSDATRAVQAGIDVVLYGQAFGRAMRAFDKLRAAGLDRSALESAAARIIELKTR